MIILLTFLITAYNIVNHAPDKAMIAAHTIGTYVNPQTISAGDSLAIIILATFVLYGLLAGLGFFLLRYLMRRYPTVMFADLIVFHSLMKRQEVKKSKAWLRGKIEPRT